jgi:hypothetical protein
MEVYREIMKPILLDALNEIFPNETWIVHHKDGNHENNELFNLEVMTNENHSRMHDYNNIQWLRDTRKTTNFPGATLQKQKNPEGKCWKCEIKWNNRSKYIALFHDPLSAHIIYELIASELNSLV